MKKVVRFLVMVFITLLMVMPSFTHADEYVPPDPITVYFPVTMYGAKGTAHMVPWTQDLGDYRYIPGPALDNPELTFNANQTKNFEIVFRDAGNFVYEVKEIRKTDSGVVYDEMIYRVFITVIYDTVEGEEVMVPLIEAQKCEDYGCLVPPGAKDVPLKNPEDIKDKPQEISFTNKKKSPPYNPPQTGITVEDVIKIGGIGIEIYIIIFLLISRRKTKEN